MNIIKDKLEKLGDALILKAIVFSLSALGLWLLKLPEYVWGLIGLILVLSHYLHKYWRQANSSKVIGIERVSLSRVSNTNEVLDLTSLRFDFWGISGNRTVKCEKFESMLKRISERGGSARFLLLDPNSETVGMRATDERESLESHRSDINATIDRLKHFRSLGYSMIEIRLFSDYPKWRVVIVDSRKMYVNYYMKGRRGNESPEVVLIDGVDSLLYPIRKTFEDLWNCSTPI